MGDKVSYIMPKTTSYLSSISTYREVMCKVWSIKQINRQSETRLNSEPVIHCGVIATGSYVVKHAPTKGDRKEV